MLYMKLRTESRDNLNNELNFLHLLFGCLFFVRFFASDPFPSRKGGLYGGKFSSLGFFFSWVNTTHQKADDGVSNVNKFDHVLEKCVAVPSPSISHTPKSCTSAFGNLLKAPIPEMGPCLYL